MPSQKQKIDLNKCAYINCSNGTNNGSYLFKFPRDLERQKIWLERSGNTELKSISNNCLRKAGLCHLHFHPSSFTTQQKTKLCQRVNPIPWNLFAHLENLTDVLKEEQHCSEKIKKLNVEISSATLNDQLVFDNSGHVKTYPSGKQLFCDFSHDDSNDMDLNYEIINRSEENTMENKMEVNEVNQSIAESQLKREEIVTIKEEMDQLKLMLMKAKKMNTQQDKVIKRLKQKIKNQTSINAKYYNGLRNYRNKLEIDNYLDYKNCVNPLSRAMITLQMREKKSQHYTDNEKTLAKLIYYHSASCYSRLRKAGVHLPCESSVRSWVSEFSVAPGFSENLLKVIRNNLLKLPEEERICALKWDEMSIKHWEEYSYKYDFVEGLVDMDFLKRENKKAKQALLLCLDSINVIRPWRQLFAYFFTDGATGEEILQIIQEGLRKAKYCGAIVKLLVCDQGPANQKAFNLLNISPDKPFFHFEEKKYHALFDWPHVIKRLIFQLRTHKKIYCGNRVIVDFKDLYDTWQIDGLNNSSNLLQHLTAAHFDPNAFEAMNVKRAFQLLSLKMSSAIKTAGLKELKSHTWKDSANFVEEMNAIIDACNSRLQRNRNPLKRPLSDRNPEIKKRLENFLEYVKNWKVMIGNKINQPPCFRGLFLTIKALLNVFEDIKSNSEDFELATGLCNQDSVEHAFSKFRGRGGFNNNPTARLFRLAFRHIISTDFLYSSLRGNVNCDEVPSLVGLESDKNKIQNEKPITDSEKNEALQKVENELDALQEEEELYKIVTHIALNGGNNINHSPPIDKKGNYEQNAITYFAGYVARQTLSKLPCSKCRDILIKTPMDSSDKNEMYIEYREYNHEDEDAPTVLFLRRPTENFKRVVSIQLDIFSKCHERFWHEKGLLANLVRIGETYTNDHYPNWFDSQNDPCYNHKINALEFLYKIKIYAKTKKNNNVFKNLAIKTMNSKCKKLKKIKHI